MGAEINWLAVLAASLVGFAVGAVWYGPLFGKAWMETVNMTPEDAAGANMAKLFGLSFVFQLLMAVNLAMFLGTEVDAGTGALYGFLAGFGWIAFALSVNALYERKSWRYMAINGGYWTVTFTLMGLVLGVWR